MRKTKSLRSGSDEPGCFSKTRKRLLDQCREIEVTAPTSAQGPLVIVLARKPPLSTKLQSAHLLLSGHLRV